jgi:hypothetical protein
MSLGRSYSEEPPFAASLSVRTDSPRAVQWKQMRPMAQNSRIILSPFNDVKEYGGVTTIA